MTPMSGQARRSSSWTSYAPSRPQRPRLDAGAAGVLCVSSVQEARALGRARPAAMLAGERWGLAPVGFQLANSPREMTAPHVSGALVVLVTQNGTAALVRCRHALILLAVAAVNMSATAAWIRSHEPAGPVRIVCTDSAGGTGPAPRTSRLQGGRRRVLGYRRLRLRDDRTRPWHVRRAPCGACRSPGNSVSSSSTWLSPSPAPRRSPSASARHTPRWCARTWPRGWRRSRGETRCSWSSTPGAPERPSGLGERHVRVPPPHRCAWRQPGTIGREDARAGTRPLPPRALHGRRRDHLRHDGGGDPPRARRGRACRGGSAGRGPSRRARDRGS